MFFPAITFINLKLSNVNSLECVSVNNQEFKIRTEVINLNTNEPMFYPYSIKINRCKGSYNTINDPINIWNHSSCDCECDKSCDIVEYLDYKNCKCRKKIIDKLVEECSENIDGNEMLYNETLNAVP